MASPLPRNVFAPGSMPLPVPVPTPLATAIFRGRWGQSPTARNASRNSALWWLGVGVSSHSWMCWLSSCWAAGLFIWSEKRLSSFRM